MKVKIENEWDLMREKVRERRRGLLRPVPAQRFFLVRFSFHIFFPFCFTSNKPDAKVLIGLDAHAEIIETNHKMLLGARAGELNNCFGTVEAVHVAFCF